MKEISELNLPQDRRYSREHGWARPDGDIVMVGITDYAQDQLGDIVFVGLPEVGDEFATDQAYGSVESVKAVSELFMPMAGTVAEINQDLEEAPEIVNADPYAAGWLIKIRAENPAELDALMEHKAYLDMIKG